MFKTKASGGRSRNEGCKKRSASINARMCAFDAKIGLFLTGFTGLSCCGRRI